MIQPIDWSTRQALIQGYLEGSLTDAESRQLLDSLRMDSSGVDLIIEGLRTDFMIRDVLLKLGNSSLPSADGIVVPLCLDGAGLRLHKHPTAARWKPLLALAASVALLLGLAWWYFSPTMEEPMLAATTGGVRLEHMGQPPAAVSAGTRLLPGDVLLTETNATAALTFGRERTRLDVGAGTELRLASLAAGKRFDLRAGRVEADVARQRPFFPLVVTTPNAEAVVVGTKFTLTATTNRTRLDVAEGKVRLVDTVSTNAGAAVKVGAGHYAVVAAATDLAALPASRGLLREYWTNFAGDDPTQLARLAAFPNHPDGTELLTNFVVRSDWGDHFGDRIRGYLHPPVTGSYVFWIAGDPNSTLNLSRNDKPEARIQIAATAGGSQDNTVLDWDRDVTQRSSPLTLVAGRRYYIEVMRKTGGGLDHLAVAWQPPGGEREIIRGEFLSPAEPEK